ncbi:unnamed protein product [Gadus morhua 'NCC']
MRDKTTFVRDNVEYQCIEVNREVTNTFRSKTDHKIWSSYVKAAEDPPGSPWRTTNGLREVFGSTTVQKAFQRMKPSPHGSASGVHRTRNPET